MRVAIFSCNRTDSMHPTDPAPNQAFVEHYYKTFDAPGGRSQLASLYQDQSMLTWEGQKMMVRA